MQRRRYCRAFDVEPNCEAAWQRLCSACTARVRLLSESTTECSPGFLKAGRAWSLQWPRFLCHERSTDLEQLGRVSLKLRFFRFCTRISWETCQIHPGFCFVNAWTLSHEHEVTICSPNRDLPSKHLASYVSYNRCIVKQFNEATFCPAVELQEVTGRHGR